MMSVVDIPTSVDAVTDDGYLDRGKVPVIGRDNRLDLHDIRPGVMGQRFTFNTEAFAEAELLLNAPEGAAYRVVLVPKNDAQYGKRGMFVNDSHDGSVTDWNLMVPVSDRFDFSEESLHYINVSLLTQVRVTSHAYVIATQFGTENRAMVDAAFNACFGIILADSFNLARQVVDSGCMVLVPSEQPAESELLSETEDFDGGEERTGQTDP